jgi:hypothetical protein
LDHLLVRDATALRQLPFGHPDIAQDLEFLDQCLVVCCPEKNSGAFAVLGQDERPACLADLVDEGGDVGSEGGKEAECPR